VQHGHLFWCGKAFSAALTSPATASLHLLRPSHSLTACMTSSNTARWEACMDMGLDWLVFCMHLHDAFGVKCIAAYIQTTRRPCFEIRTKPLLLLQSPWWHECVNRWWHGKSNEISDSEVSHGTTRMDGSVKVGVLRVNCAKCYRTSSARRSPVAVPGICLGSCENLRLKNHWSRTFACEPQFLYPIKIHYMYILTHL